jgi:hypothetical protein
VERATASVRGSPALRALVITFFFFATAWTSLALDRPPAPLPGSAPADVFSAERAMVRVQRLAVAPHPVGTREHDRVRDELIAELTALGAAPSVQRTTGVTPLYQVAGAVENVVARVEGTGGKNDAVLLAAHCDSVPAGPGAGDDASGVAVLLETLRALLASGVPKNDVIFLFTDGEEEGMLGASAFVAEHPWAEDVRVVLNFEARGSGGISQLFETSAGNGRLIRALGRDAPHGRASSLAYEVYRLMPNDTDLTILKRGGAAAMNFGFIGDSKSYHTPIDDAARLDRGSLQQHGENALALARNFGNADLGDLRAGDDVFFNVLGGPIVHYPQWFGWLLCLVAAAAWIGIAVRGRRADFLTYSDLPFGGVVQLAALLALLVIALAYGLAVGALHARLPWEGDVLRDPWYLAALCALLVATWTALFRLARRRAQLPGLLLGGALDVLVLTVAATRWAPGGAFLFAWPLLGLLAGSWIATRGSGDRSPLVLALLGLSALPALVLLVPLVRGLHEAVGFGWQTVMGFAFFLGVGLMAIAPLLDALLEAAGKAVPLAAVATGVLLSIQAARSARYDGEQPKPSMVAYALDTAANNAKWACFAERSDRWTAQFVGAHPAKGKLPDFYPDWLPSPFLLGNAPVLPIPPPSATLLDQSTSADGVRTLRVTVSSPRHARTLTVVAPDADVLQSWVDGKYLGRPSEARWTSNHWSFGYSNPPPAGIELKLRVQGAAPVTLFVIDRSSGLPQVPGQSFAPRPVDSMPIHTGDQTMVKARFEF